MKVTRYLFASLLGFGLIFAQGIVAHAACSPWGTGDGCEQDMYGYDYNEAFGQGGYYSGTYTNGEFAVDTFRVGSGSNFYDYYTVEIYYNEAGEDSGAFIRRPGGCVTQYDNQGQEMGSSGC